MISSPSLSSHEIIDGLAQAGASISPKYFYNSRGSALFEQITHLPEYYLTRTEREIMAQHGHAIAAKVGPGATVIEPGAGNCKKALSLCGLLRPARFVALDISAEYLHHAVAGLRSALPKVDIRAVAADLTTDFTVPPDIPRANRLVFYPGSSIGNFEPAQALALLSRIRHLLDEDGALLIGVDLVKDIAVLEAAYSDAAGVTAAFNLNILQHVNQLIGSDFDPDQWQHRAFFNAARSRIEMHLHAVTDILVRWPGGERRFSQDERIHTENSYKYRTEDVVALLDQAGLGRTDIWVDPQHWFAVMLARP